ncbi:hypothetical protein CWE12_05560 [Aliidiomarina sedimenti]|uniref:Transmembrane cytochrome oxidase associated protein n=1 Tax=Aliidiomarina sedimenti TaxID=1933879 RepID=A0ABY0C038_9GAMM|nr:hypothetical protein [Aliidiomarina sedimenti]RUO30709.1 hypothetical protein CWE12_05560 [Aliidiomarina sedimenti]
MTTSDNSSTAQSEQQRKQKNRRLFIGIFLCFLIPLAGAQIILSLGWFTPGVTNKGELISPPIEASSSENESMPQTWRLAYRVPADCDQRCINGLYVIQQVDMALGRDSDRVTPIAIQAGSEVSALPAPEEGSRLQYLVLPQLHDQLSEQPQGSLFIIDPLGAVMMRYEGSADRDTAIQSGSDMLDDLKKLLKMSRVG